MKGQLSGKSTSTENGLSNINYHVKEHGYFVVVAGVVLAGIIMGCGTAVVTWLVSVF